MYMFYELPLYQKQNHWICVNEQTNSLKFSGHEIKNYINYSATGDCID